MPHGDLSRDSGVAEASLLVGELDKIISKTILRQYMAKSLGQIHNVNIRAGPFTAVNQKYNCDLAAELTAQLQRMVRAGTYHKLVGVDMTLEFPAVTAVLTVSTGVASISSPQKCFEPSCILRRSTRS